MVRRIWTTFSRSDKLSPDDATLPSVTSRATWCQLWAKQTLQRVVVVGASYYIDGFVNLEFMLLRYNKVKNYTITEQQLSQKK